MAPRRHPLADALQHVAPWLAPRDALAAAVAVGGAGARRDLALSVSQTPAASRASVGPWSRLVCEGLGAPELLMQLRAVYDACAGAEVDAGPLADGGARLRSHNLPASVDPVVALLAQ
jgi:hypothetical protein